MAPVMDSSENGPGADASHPTPRELRAARRRAHEQEKQKRADTGGGGKGGKAGKGGKMGKGGGNEDAAADARRRH